MKKKMLIALVVVLALAATASVVWAGSPITEKVTGGGHFISDRANTVGHLVYLSLVGMEKSGEWSGQGSYRDPGIGLEAHFNFSSEDPVAVPGWICICLEGTAEVYIYGEPDGIRSVRACVVDVFPYDGDVDRIGIKIDWPSYHYSHLGDAVTDYAGRIKIH